MNPDTLTLYTIASGLCFCLSLVLLVFAQVRRGTWLIRSSALGMMTLAVGFLGSAVGPLLPFWVTVIGMNATLLAGGLWFHSGIRAFVTQQPQKPDNFGWLSLACAMPLFAYWGLIEPNGIYRSVVFSFTACVIHSRTTWLLVSYSRQHHTFKSVLSVLTLTFGIFSIWMLIRGGILLFLDSPPVDTKSLNPTHWQTVFAFNILASVFVASLLMVEMRHRPETSSAEKNQNQITHDNLLLLYGVITVILIAILCETGIAYLVLEQRKSVSFPSHVIAVPLLEPHPPLMTKTDLILQATILGAVLAIAVVIAMGLILAASIKRRDEQDRFLSMISHELRTPMSVIRMVSESPAIPENTRFRITRAVDNMNAIIDSALQADRLQYGLIETQRIPCDLDDLLHSLQADSTDPVRIHLHPLPQVVCKTDPQWLKVIVGNLLDNALKYSPSGSEVEVHVESTPIQHKLGWSVTVTNAVDLTQIPDNSQIFRKYYRGANARGKTGSGLGLHIADGLARLLGGHLKYSHSENKVEFTLWIPL